MKGVTNEPRSRSHQKSPDGERIPLLPSCAFREWPNQAPYPFRNRGIRRQISHNEGAVGWPVLGNLVSAAICAWIKLSTQANQTRLRAAYYLRRLFVYLSTDGFRVDCGPQKCAASVLKSEFPLSFVGVRPDSPQRVCKSSDISTHAETPTSQNRSPKLLT